MSVGLLDLNKDNYKVSERRINLSPRRLTFYKIIQRNAHIESERKELMGKFHTILYKVHIAKLSPTKLRLKPQLSTNNISLSWRHLPFKTYFSQSFFLKLASKSQIRTFWDYNALVLYFSTSILISEYAIVIFGPILRCCTFYILVYITLYSVYCLYVM